MATISVELGMNPQATGSASCTSHGVMVQASVFGPLPLASGMDSNPLAGSLHFTSGGSIRDSPSVDAYVVQAVESVVSSVVVLTDYPQSVFDIHLSTPCAVGSESGMDLSAPAIQAVVCALLDAGVHMRSVPVAMTISQTEGETEGEPPRVTVAIDAVTSRVLYADMCGVVVGEDQQKLMDTAISSCLGAYQSLTQSLSSQGKDVPGVAKEEKEVKGEKGDTAME
ncbi:hypothetical protein KIPB_003264 [Kipferlia bialata]|uniref:Exoribonuclease phosphorolytic domain-containing protein n=1 Tax=Kipferlia bialata TaxID=797122 RepID=A0A9K3CTH2_9EUKA|nr:hypothetical protein KIPB_003264 [Kipferlia bialata]|eukprot:g3264.t1